jgi:hypothetical protein
MMIRASNFLQTSLSLYTSHFLVSLFSSEKTTNERSRITAVRPISWQPLTTLWRPGQWKLIWWRKIWKPGNTRTWLKCYITSVGGVKDGLGATPHTPSHLPSKMLLRATSIAPSLATSSGEYFMDFRSVLRTERIDSRSLFYYRCRSLITLRDKTFFITV